MQTGWNETLDVVNTYVRKLASEVNLNINLAFFDSSPGEPVLQTRYLKEWVDLSPYDESIRPRGMTPLYDAIGKFASRIKEQGLTKNDLVQFVVMTDGQENCSREYKHNQIKKLLENMEKQNWSVQYLGANLEATDYAASFVYDSGKLATADWFDSAIKTSVTNSLYSSTMRYVDTRNVAASAFTTPERESMTKAKTSKS